MVDNVVPLEGSDGTRGALLTVVVSFTEGDDQWYSVPVFRVTDDLA
ncbi:MAG: hypothetical protein R2705_15040 [Ilumatobacteraceae bacterium]